MKQEEKLHNSFRRRAPALRLYKARDTFERNFVRLLRDLLLRLLEKRAAAVVRRQYHHPLDLRTQQPPRFFFSLTGEQEKHVGYPPVLWSLHACETDHVNAALLDVVTSDAVVLVAVL